MRIALLILAGCSWSDSITRMGPTPDPAGPCLQITHPGRHHWELYKGDRRVGYNTDTSYVQAYVDYPESAALMASSRRFDKLAVQLGVPGMLTGIAIAAAGELASSNVTFGIGGGLMAASFLTAGILAYLADSRWGDSVAEYNTWASTHGCRQSDSR